MSVVFVNYGHMQCYITKHLLMYVPRIHEVEKHSTLLVGRMQSHFAGGVTIGRCKNCEPSVQSTFFYPDISIC